MYIWLGGLHRPPKRKKRGPRSPSTTCATSKVGTVLATKVPRLTYTTVSVVEMSRWKAQAAPVARRPYIK
jgi:hypothetical protein